MCYVLTPPGKPLQNRLCYSLGHVPENMFCVDSVCSNAVPISSFSVPADFFFFFLDPEV